MKELVSKGTVHNKSGLLIKSSRLKISELRNYFAKIEILIKKKIKLITWCSKWTGPTINYIKKLESRNIYQVIH